MDIFRVFIGTAITSKHTVFAARVLVRTETRFYPNCKAKTDDFFPFRLHGQYEFQLPYWNQSSDISSSHCVIPALCVWEIKKCLIKTSVTRKICSPSPTSPPSAWAWAITLTLWILAKDTTRESSELRCKRDTGSWTIWKGNCRFLLVKARWWKWGKKID